MGTPDSRSVALSLLDAVRRQDTLLTAALRHELFRHDLDPRTSASANRAALGTLRNRRLLDALLAPLASRGLPTRDERLMDLLRLAMHEFLFMDAVPDYATLSSYVDLARKTKGSRVAGFVNALLRKAASRGREALLADATSLPLADRFSYPEHVVEAARQVFGDEAPDQLAWMNRPAPIGLSVHTGRTDRNALSSALRQAGLHPAAVDFAPAGLVLPPDEPPYQTLQFAQGLFWPQDPASQMVTRLALCGEEAAATVDGGRRVLDACAGNGTKSLGLALASRPGTEIVALDLSEPRIKLLRQRLEELEIPGVTPVVSDLLAAPYPPGSFGTVLVDAPCTGLGTVRRHPELKWRRSAADIAANAALQARLIEAAAGLVAPGGTLVYTVCTFTPLETSGVTSAFLAGHPEFRLVPAAELSARGVALPETVLLSAAPTLSAQRPATLFLRPSLFDSDCFFAAVFARGAQE
jgi:16S rRNA (cytosine967-C5)-methyltransferase